MATATRKAGSVGDSGHGAVDVTRLAPSAFRVFENNGGDYHWTLESASGETLARSGAFTSYDAAERAATNVRNGAASAQVERRSADSPVRA